VTTVVARPAPSTPVKAPIGQTWLPISALAGALLGVRALLLVSAVLIGGTLWWCLRQTPNQLLAYADVPTHLNLARRLHDDLHPGLGQLGDYWLPLTHVLELPFVWNDTLWHSGLAGAIPSMACYLISVWCIYRLMELATGERFPAMIAGLAFAANPNVLYLHVQAMFEPALIASMLLATYALARWLQGEGYGWLVAAAAAACVSTTSRYEAWGFAMASVVVVTLALWQRGDRGPRLRGHILFYILLAWYGMALWLLWNLALSGDPFYFLHPSFNKGLGEARLAVLTKGHLPRAAAYTILSIADNAGPLLVGAATLGLWRTISAFGLRARGLWIYLLAAPAVFDVLYLGLKGTPPILVPQLIPHVSGNIRYGLVSLPLLCVLLGYLARRPPATVSGAGLAPTVLRAVLPAARMVWPVVQGALLAAVVAQPLFLVQRHFVVSYNEPNTSKYAADQQARVDLAHWLGAHYDGGHVLMSTFKGADRVILASGLPNREFIHEGSQNTWKCALRRPQRWARWIILFKGRDGAAALLTSKSVAGGEYYTRLTNVGGGSLYYVFRRNSKPWHPAHPGPCE
jgi:Dolichyl-phosphate-mannose-protein mannosyltransferase